MTAPVPVYRGSAFIAMSDLLLGDLVTATEFTNDTVLNGTVVLIAPTDTGYLVTLRYLLAAHDDMEPDAPAQVVDFDIDDTWIVALRERLSPQPDQYLPGTLWLDDLQGQIYVQTDVRLTAESGVPYSRLGSHPDDDGPQIGTDELTELLSRLHFMSTTS